MAFSSWNDDFLDLLDCLVKEDVEFLIVGAFALAQHGLPRATGDIDVWVRPSRENANRLILALTAFGAPLASAGVVAADFEKPGMVYQLGVVPRRIDLLTELSALSFDEGWASRSERTIDGRSISFLGAEALLKNKSATGRPKDLADVAALRQILERK